MSTCILPWNDVEITSLSSDTELKLAASIVDLSIWVVNTLEAIERDNVRWMGSFAVAPAKRKEKFGDLSYEMLRSGLSKRQGVIEYELARRAKQDAEHANGGTA